MAHNWRTDRPPERHHRRGAASSSTADSGRAVFALRALAALARHLPQLEPAGIAAGLHLVAWLPDHYDENAVVAAAAAEGVAIAPVSRFRLGPPRRAGLSFGYSSLDERAIADGVMRLARAMAKLG